MIPFHFFNLSSFFCKDSPPIYDLNSVNAPIHLYWSDNDWIANPTDIEVKCLVKIFMNKISLIFFNDRKLLLCNYFYLILEVIASSVTEEFNQGKQQI